MIRGDESPWMIISAYFSVKYRKIFKIENFCKTYVLLLARVFTVCYIIQRNVKERKKNMAKKETYDESSISVLEGLEA
ncbi:MAG: hypothetical protein PUA99_03980, partial [Roseburia hominis]|nr:hypothetical protein [Roseburia hominis]